MSKEMRSNKSSESGGNEEHGIGKYTPSPEAVEVLARAMCGCSDPVWHAVRESEQPYWREQARRALIALMGATVTEPCAKCYGASMYDHWDDGVDGDRRKGDCPACHGSPLAPRSLAVRECEKAGVLEPYAMWVGDSPLTMFAERPPSTGEATPDE